MAETNEAATAPRLRRGMRARAALDGFMAAFNREDVEAIRTRWFHFPHVRFHSGKVTVMATPADHHNLVWACGGQSADWGGRRGTIRKRSMRARKKYIFVFSSPAIALTAPRSAATARFISSLCRTEGGVSPHVRHGRNSYSHVSVCRKRRRRPTRRTHEKPRPHPCRDEWATQECGPPDGRRPAEQFRHGARDTPVGDAVAAGNRSP